MDNPTMARLLAETADLLEIGGGDGFRIRSYRRAAEAVEQTTVDLMAAAGDVARLLEIPGIGKGMAANLQAIAATGTLPLREELLARYGAGLLELLKLPGMGPRTVALLWDAAKVASVDELAQAIDGGRLAGLPRMGAKQIEKLRKGIEDYRRSAGRFRIDEGAQAAERILAYLMGFPGIEKVTPAGSLRRGRETVGDLDLLVTGPACAPEHTGAAVEHVAAYPGIHDIIAKGGEQGQLSPVERVAGGRTAAADGKLRGGAAVLHRVEGAQRGAAAAGAQDGLHAERVGPGSSR